MPYSVFRFNFSSSLPSLMKMANTGLIQRRHKQEFKVPSECEVQPVASIGLDALAAPFVMLTVFAVTVLLLLAGERRAKAGGGPPGEPQEGEYE